MELRALALVGPLLLAGCAGSPAGEPERFALLPQTCRLVPEATAAAVTGEAVGTPGNGVAGRSGSCDWKSKADGEGRQALSVNATHYTALEEGTATLSGVELAQRTFEGMRAGHGAALTPGIGDDVYRVSSGMTEKLEFRTANLVVSVSVTNAATPDAATTVARAVLGELAKQGR